MDKKFETGNTAHNTGHASHNPNSASNSPLESNPASRVSQPADQFQDDEISLKELILKIQEWWRYLLSKWLVILIAGLLGGALGLFYSIYKKPTYTATLTFVLEEEGGGMGNLGGLASMAGFSIANGGGNGLFKGDNIFEIYKSRTMLTKTLLSSSSLNDSLLIDRYIQFNDLRTSWVKDTQLTNLSFSIPIEKFTLKHDSVLGQIVASINSSNLNVSKLDKKTSLIQVSTTTTNEMFSKDFTEILVKNVNDFYVETKTKKALENLNILQQQTDSIRKELNSAIGSVAFAEDANPNANLARQILRVPSSRKQVEVEANQAILTELVKNLEMAKISLRNETPLIQIIDEPVLPLGKERFSKVKAVLLGSFFSGVFIIICLFFRWQYLILMKRK